MTTKAKINAQTAKTTKSFFGAVSSQNKKYDSEVYGDFFLYNSSEDERELHELLDCSIKQSVDSSSNYD